MNSEDVRFMKIAVEQARLDPRPYKVGAVVVSNGQELGRGHGGEPPLSDHAEATLLARISQRLDGATLYTTLEPCTRRGHPDKACAVLALEKGVNRVVIGSSDPNPNIENSAELFFKKHGIEVLYLHEFKYEIQEIMGDWFIQQRGRKA
jgi:pyrimidine deaminase RibD-like protein